jgi:4-methylaminobutanoate oxidase (formaldehyde-forming)
VSWVAGESDAYAWGGELILRNGVGTGQVTSAAFGATAGACVGLGYVRRGDDVVDADWLDAQWSVNVSGRIVPITVSTTAIYDPTSARVRS